MFGILSPDYRPFWVHPLLVPAESWCLGTPQQRVQSSTTTGRRSHRCSSDQKWYGPNSPGEARNVVLRWPPQTHLCESRKSAKFPMEFPNSNSNLPCCVTFTILHSWGDQFGFQILKNLGEHRSIWWNLLFACGVFLGNRFAPNHVHPLSQLLYLEGAVGLLQKPGVFRRIVVFFHRSINYSSGTPQTKNGILNCAQSHLWTKVEHQLLHPLPQDRLHLVLEQAWLWRLWQTGLLEIEGGNFSLSQTATADYLCWNLRIFAVSAFVSQVLCMCQA